MGNKSQKPVPPRSAELTEAAAEVVDRINAASKIPKKYLIEEAVLEYLPVKYEQQSVQA